MRGKTTQATLDRRAFLLRAVAAVGGCVVWPLRPLQAVAGSADPVAVDQEFEYLTADSSLRIGDLMEVRLV